MAEKQFASYVTGLAQELAGLYTTVPQGVTLDITAEDMALHIEQTIPPGLLANAERKREPMRILVVEDEQIIAADLEGKLMSLGHEVVGTAVSGAEAIQSAEQFRPDLVLMDIQLRGPMNGIEAAKHIQQSTGAQIVFLTAFAGLFMQNPAQMPSPGLCLSKPYSKYQLEAILQAVPSR